MRIHVGLLSASLDDNVDVEDNDDEEEEKFPSQKINVYFPNIKYLP